MKSKFLLIGLCFGFFISGCVSATFVYHWFYPEFVSYEGKLLGKKPSEDLDGKVCQKDAQGNHGCVVMLKNEFESLATDYLDLQDRLVECQRKCQ